MSEQSSRLAVALADRYAIERELGAGGMATVYLAHDVKHDRKVAVKVLKPELAAVLGAERFLNEIKVTANLQHPHILPLHDSGEAEGFVYYVMPYVEGESLRAKLEREKELSIEETVEITKAVASALDYAHRHEVIHRDIKPENILLHEGQPVVADFGIALAVSAAGGARLTETGLSLGTPQYMSPEQAMGDRELDGRSDIYSLACVTYEMLAGEAPYTGPTAQAIVAKIVTEEWRSARRSPNCRRIGLGRRPTSSMRS
jgi:serine/threonine-protein kinase